MDDFNAYMSEYQVAWRQSQSLPEGQGWQNRKQRPWILPQKHWEEGLWPGICSGSAYSLLSYLQRNRVQKHTGVHNLKSSWMLCANLYFPFRASEEGLSLLAGFLQAHVAPEIQSVDAVELEYAEAEDSPLHPSCLLGEQGGSRGAGQTSPDVAFLVNCGRGLVLMENKFVEHSFYPCSAHRHKGSSARVANPDPARCDNALAVLDDPKSLCHQVAWGRRYWDHLAPVMNREMASRLRCCPAARAGYQLFRQQALAEGIASSGTYDFVVSCVALDGRNDTLIHCLKSTKIPNVREWGELFQGKASFAVVSHQQWVAWVRAHNDGQWADWLDYVGARYGYTP
jgi:hypothetical protein